MGYRIWFYILYLRRHPKRFLYFKFAIDVLFQHNSSHLKHLNFSVLINTMLVFKTGLKFNMRSDSKNFSNKGIYLESIKNIPKIFTISKFRTV